MCVHKNTHTQVWLLMAISQSLTFTIWLLKLRRGLGLSLIRSCGAKSNQSKREQRAKPSPYKRVSVVCSVWLLSQQESVFGCGLPQSKATSLSLCVHFFTLFSCLSCIFFSSQAKKEWEGWRVFASYSSPCSRCLTLTSQYDTDAICLSPPDITTVLPAVGAWGLLH